jgi:Ca-activated chloride channel family protein
MVTLLCAVLAMGFLALAEWLHARRVRRVSYLAFGPGGSPRSWTAFAPALRVAAVGTITWGLVTLLGIGAPPLEAFGSGDARSLHHVVIALDVSPSMDLPDAGPKEDQSRSDRARDVIRSVLERLDARRTRTSIIAFYTNAKPVVVDTFDPEVTANVLADLPLEHAFAAGKTDLYSGVREAAKVGKDWRERSATLLIVSDGDTLPSQEIPALPRAYSSVLILGVGSPSRGTFIDGHSSRQDAQSLERLALRLGGRYYNATARHLPSDAVTAAAAALPAEKGEPTDLRWLAVVATGCGSLVLALLPPLLALVGTGHRPWSAGEPLTVPAATSSRRQSRELLQTGA